MERLMGGWMNERRFESMLGGRWMNGTVLHWIPSVIQTVLVWLEHSHHQIVSTPSSLAFCFSLSLTPSSLLLCVSLSLKPLLHIPRSILILIQFLSLPAQIAFLRLGKFGMKCRRRWGEDHLKYILSSLKGIDKVRRSPLESSLWVVRDSHTLFPPTLPTRSIFIPTNLFPSFPSLSFIPSLTLSNSSSHISLSLSLLQTVSFKSNPCSKRVSFSSNRVNRFTLWFTFSWSLSRLSLFLSLLSLQATLSFSHNHRTFSPLFTGAKDNGQMRKSEEWEVVDCLLSSHLLHAHTGTVTNKKWKTFGRKSHPSKSFGNRLQHNLIQLFNPSRQ